MSLTFKDKGGKFYFFQICTPTSIPYTASRASEFFKMCLLLALALCIGAMAYIISFAIVRFEIV